ncbi:hypothetical protein AaE_014284 [Aphanomyces astaci]|uniref:Uncharacterized protein n=1 Tax=Aphanomyces astaci TaxID=112090 RepID=A0A6A4Z0X9_APHAT|nr:hypothetical protein AaE_014284 [Aphanomyces astaci]
MTDDVAFMGFAPLASTTLTNGTVEGHSAAATYIVSLGLSFPCDFGAFEPVTLSSPIPPLDGIWQVNLVSTNESVHFACTTGIYRRSPDNQGRYNNSYWSLPSNVVAFAANLDFNDDHRFKDSWGTALSRARHRLQLGRQRGRGLVGDVAYLAGGREVLDPRHLPVHPTPR